MAPVRMVAWPVIARLGGPGRIDPYNPAGALLFQTGKDGLANDAVAVFFGRDMDTLDWLADYLMDVSLLEKTDAEKGPSFAVEEEVEEHFDKKVLTTTDTDAGWDIT